MTRRATTAGCSAGPDATVALCVPTRENDDRSYGVDRRASLPMARVGLPVFRRFNPSAGAPPPR